MTHETNGPSSHSPSIILIAFASSHMHPSSFPPLKGKRRRERNEKKEKRKEGEREEMKRKKDIREAPLERTGNKGQKKKRERKKQRGRKKRDRRRTDGEEEERSKYDDLYDVFYRGSSF